MQSMEEPERCSICGRSLAREWQVIFDDDGTQEHGWVTTEDAILANTSTGEILICMTCYPDRVEKQYTGDDLAEIHYQRGLGLIRPGHMLEARKCFLRALAINRKADYLASLAVTFESRDEEDRISREALLLDPGCLVAQLNLARPRNAHAGTDLAKGGLAKGGLAKGDCAK